MKSWFCALWGEKNEIDVIAVSETGLCRSHCFADHRCATVPHLEGWTWMGKARNNRGGGVGFLIREEVAFTVRGDLEDQHVEAQWIEIHRDRLPSLLCCSVYIPPRDARALQGLETVVQRAKQKHRLVMLLGDFNARSTVFGDNADNDLAEHILSFVANLNLIVINDHAVPTRFSRESSSIIDLTLASRALAPHCTDWQTFESLPTDHCALSFSIGQSSGKRIKQAPRVTWDFKHCDWDAFEAKCDDVLSNWFEQMSRPNCPARSIDALYQSWVDTVQSIVNEIVPTRKLTFRSRAFWSDDIARLVTRRRRCLRRSRRYKTIKARREYALANRNAREAIRHAKNDLLRAQAQFLASASRGDVFRRYRRVTSRPQRPLPVLKVGDRVLRGRREQAEALNSRFSTRGDERPDDNFDNAFRDSVDRAFAQLDLKSEESLQKGGVNSNITTQEVEAEIARLGTFKTPGPDLIHPIFLKKGGYQARKTLTIILNTSFLIGKVPFLWRVANITPIPKKPGSDISFFRPISVLSVPGKLLDSIVAQRISYTAEINNWLKPFQGGFRRGRSTTDQLIEFRERICMESARKRVCVTAFLDISSAYDSVWRQGLIYKLKGLGLRGRILVWVVAFLTKRFGAVCIDGVFARRKEFKCGLPQGSCLSPVLFNVYLSDMFPFDFVSAKRSTGLFADDVRVSTFDVTVALASKELTLVLEIVHRFSQKWRLRFDVSSDKCGTMTFALFPVRARETVYFGMHSLACLSEYKYLGVIFDQHLTFRSHIERVRQKAWAASHQIRNMTSRFWGVSTLVMVRLYRSFVCPILDKSGDHKFVQWVICVPRFNECVLSKINDCVLAGLMIVCRP